MPLAAEIGTGIDHTMRARVGGAPGQVSAVDAVDLLNRNVQPLPARQVPRGATPAPIGELRGLLARGGLDAGHSTQATAGAGSGWTPPQRNSRTAPYARIREYERVLGISFKIQPPQQSPEPTAPSL